MSINIYVCLILLILIVICVYYLVYRNFRDLKTLESFDNRNSLSTYFQNTVDSDDYSVPNNSYNYSTPPTITTKSLWNGIWKKTDGFFVYFLQINDKLVINISNNDLSPENMVANATIVNNITTCPSNTFLAIGQLNNDRNYFYVSKILCSNINTTGTLTLLNTDHKTSSLTGTINTDGSITITDNQTSPITVILNKLSDFTHRQNSSLYAQYSSFVTPMPNVITSEIDDEYFICPQSPIKTYPCIYTGRGLTGTITSPGGEINACSTIGVNSDKSCKLSSTPNPSADIKCVFYSSSKTLSDGTTVLTSCPAPTGNYYNNLNFMSNIALTSMSGSVLQICDYLTYFQASACNAVILAYVSNLGDVKTLNYQMFGSMPNQSSLTTQYDVWYDYLNNSSSTVPLGLLYNYRKAVSASPSSCTKNMISLTNLDQNPSTKSATCSKISSYVSAFNNTAPPNPSYANLYPAIWQINVDSSSAYNTSNSCTFSLSTHADYNSATKYVEYNSTDNTTNLSLYPGGTQQNLMLENVNIIKKSSSTCVSEETQIYDVPQTAPLPSLSGSPCTETGNMFVAMTANIRTSNGMYLEPGLNNSGFQNNSSTIKLVSKPSVNGKWFIYGFNLMGTFDNTVVADIIKNNLN